MKATLTKLAAAGIVLSFVLVWGDPGQPQEWIAEAIWRVSTGALLLASGLLDRLIVRLAREIEPPAPRTQEDSRNA